MGKYMKKSQITADVALMELSQSIPLGVRTRAKTLALQRLNSPPPSSSSSSYLQLRSRRLEMRQDTNNPQDAQLNSQRKNLNCKDSSRVSKKGGGDFVEKCEAEDLGVEVSFGDNYLDFESRERECTPCSLIRDPESIDTPGSTTRPKSSTRATENMLSNIPTTHEMEEFFSRAEQEQQRLFIEKYNFDVANDLPLSGRYEWVQVIP